MLRIPYSPWPVAMWCLVRQVGASQDLLEAPNARLQLHTFSAENARTELECTREACPRGRTAPRALRADKSHLRTEL